MTDLTNLLLYVSPASVASVSRWAENGDDLWDFTSAATLQASIDANVVWQVGATPVTGQQAFDAITAYEAAKSLAQSTRDQKTVDDAQDHTDIVDSSQIRALITARPAQIDTYIDNNVTDLATARDVLKILAKAISIIGKSEFK